MIRFTASTTHPYAPRGWIWVVVHDSVEQLQAAAARFSPGFDHGETEACFQAQAYSTDIDDDGRVVEPAGRYAGIMRLLPSHGGDVIAHEATHAALAIYFRQHAAWVPADDEEPLAYAIGDVVRAISVEYIDRGLWL